MVEPVDVSAGFEAFYRRAWRDAARWAAGLTGDVSAGEEIAQEAFLLIAPRFNELTNPDAYLRVTVVNLARSSARSSGRRSIRERRAVSIAVPPAPPVEDNLLAALDHLSYEQRAVLVLRYWADWSETAIAEVLGCQTSTIRSHARRALGRLRKEIQQ